MFLFNVSYYIFWDVLIKKKKDGVKLTLAPKMRACIEDRRESGKEAKALLLCAARSPVKRHRHTLKPINGHYLFGLFRVVFLNICCHFLAMILRITTLNFKLIKVSSVFYCINWVYYVKGKHLVISLTP